NDNYDDRDLIVLYAGDYDPSGMFMSQEDLPRRLSAYGGDHVVFRRIALLPHQVVDLPSFDATDKKTDKRYKWFVKNHGDRCWELDAMDPGLLRATVESEIEALIEPEAWARCEKVNSAELESLQTILTGWRAA